MSNYDLLKHMAAGLGNAIVYDTDADNPGLYVPLDRSRMCDLLDTDDETTHPAFIIGQAEVLTIFAGKYRGMMRDGRMYSLPLEKPEGGMTQDELRAACAAKGAGHHMVTLAERALMLLLGKAAGHTVIGNTQNGRHIHETAVTGIPCAYTDEGDVKMILEGTGTAAYYHNGSQRGIYGMGGNLREMIAGYRTVDGEIQIIPNNDAAANVEQGENSELWRAILPDGTLTAPGTAGTLKWHWVDGAVMLDTETTVEDAVRGAYFNDLAVNTQNLQSGAPLILRALALFPDGDTGVSAGDWIQINTSGIRHACCGAAYESGEAGAWSMDVTHESADMVETVGTRPMYYPAAEHGDISYEIDENGHLVYWPALSSGFMSFDIDENGELQYTRTMNVDIEFDLEKGVLIANG